MFDRSRSKHPFPPLLVQHPEPRGCLPDGCALMLLYLIVPLAVILLIALSLHPQGFPVIPWLMSHL